MRTSRTFVFCFVLNLCATALSQVGGDRRPTPPKTNSPKTTPKKTIAPPKRTTSPKKTTSTTAAPSNTAKGSNYLIKRAQEALTLAGYTVPANGDMNTHTVAAIRGFQADRGIPISGKLGSETLFALGLVVRNQYGMELIYVPAGSFMMGSNNGEADEKPAHRVTISNGFYVGRHEVTQAQWQQVMGSNPSKFKGCDQCPVENLTWNDAQEFIRRLNASTDGYIYRLPTEAEWEYACRAGTTTAFAFGDSLSSDQANFNGNYPYGLAKKGPYRQMTTSVGSFEPNAFGLYDMHGNVSEWCQDWHYNNYKGAPNNGGAWERVGTQQNRVLRGGSWIDDADTCRSSNRVKDKPNKLSNLFGIRVVAAQPFILK